MRTNVPKNPANKLSCTRREDCWTNNERAHGKWFERAVVATVALLPLIIVPGIERPFSTPKIILLGGVVVFGSIFRLITGGLIRPVLPPGFSLALIASFFALALSAIFGAFVSYEALGLSLFSMGWFLLIVSLKPNAVNVAISISVSCAVVSVIAALQYLDLDPVRFLGWTAPAYGSSRMRVFGTLGNPNFVAALLVAGLPLSIALGKTIKNGAAFYSMAGLAALAIFATGSRAAVVAVFAVMVWFVIIKHFSGKRVIVSVAAVSLAMLVFMQSRPLITTIEGRLYIWRVTASHLLERPLFGYGPGAFGPKYIEWETQYWRDGKGAPEERKFAALQAHAHNDYLETMTDRGLVGLLSVLSLMVSFLVFAFRQYRLTGDGLIAGASSGVVALASVAFVDFPFHRPAELFIFWTLMAIVFLACAGSKGSVPGSVQL